MVRGGGGGPEEKEEEEQDQEEGQRTRAMLLNGRRPIRQDAGSLRANIAGRPNMCTEEETLGLHLEEG